MNLTFRPALLGSFLSLALIADAQATVLDTQTQSFAGSEFFPLFFNNTAALESLQKSSLISLITF